MLLYTAIIIYILSLIIGLFVMAAVKTISKKIFFSVVSVHVLCLLFFIFSKFSSASPGEVPETNLFFLFFICTGIILAGLAWRSPVSVIFRVYFTLFAFTIVLFFFSPSRLMVFLLTGKYSETLGKIFPVKENYFLEQQGSSTDNQRYKLIRKRGIFHETIQRDLVFKGTLDSISVLEFIPKEKTIVRGYSGKVTFVSTDIDSADVEIKLIKEKQNQVQRKL